MGSFGFLGGSMDDGAHGILGLHGIPWLPWYPLVPMDRNPVVFLAPIDRNPWIEVHKSDSISKPERTSSVTPRWFKYDVHG